MTNNKYIISEFYDFSANREVILEAERNHQPVILSGILQKAGTLNRNGRVYPLDILQREIKNYMELVESKTATGELDHPDSAVVSLANVSHIVTEMWWEGEEVHGKVQITDTPAGDILKGLLKSGVMLGISSRGVGSVKSEGGKDIVQEDFELIAFDFVSSPSTPGAYLFKEGRQWGMTKLVEDNAKIVRASEEELNEYISKHKNLQRLAGNDFWKNI